MRREGSVDGRSALRARMRKEDKRSMRGNVNWNCGNRNRIKMKQLRLDRNSQCSWRYAKFPHWSQPRSDEAQG